MRIKRRCSMRPGRFHPYRPLCAGLLVYNSLINLMVAQFPPVSIAHRPLLQAGQYAALAAGYAAMAIVAKWA